MSKPLFFGLKGKETQKANKKQKNKQKRQRFYRNRFQQNLALSNPL